MLLLIYDSALINRGVIIGKCNTTVVRGNKLAYACGHYQRFRFLLIPSKDSFIHEPAHKFLFEVKEIENYRAFLFILSNIFVHW